MFLTLLPYLTVAANLALVLGILLGLNQRVQKLRSSAGQHEKKMQAETARLSAEIVELKSQILELEQSDHSVGSLGSLGLSAASVSASPAAPGNSVNSTLRSKVLKMHRLGQSPDRIAGALRVPKGEVDLLVKVHKIVMRPYEEVVLSPILDDAAEKV